VVPRRVIPDVLCEEALDKRELARPHSLVARAHENPLPVRPRVIVLLVRVERVRDERKLMLVQRTQVQLRVSLFQRALAERTEEQAPVVPNLVVLEELDRKGIHERPFIVKRGTNGDEGLEAVLPAMEPSDLSETRTRL
jgi:hypothetical protein